jgi:RNA polymerase sigma-70 factor (ECF subfamily)
MIGRAEHAAASIDSGSPADLLAQAGLRDSEADFVRLYTRSWGRIVASLMALTGSLADAEDCAQETFERAYQAWSRWSPDAPAEAWLHRIAINVGIDHRRRERLRQIGQVLRRVGRPEAPPDPASFADRDDLLAALRRLPAKQAAAIVLRHLHGYSNREIGVALGVPERTVASRLAAARERLQADLGPAWRQEMGTSEASAVPEDDG